MIRSLLHAFGLVFIGGSLVATLGCDYNDSPSAPDNAVPGPEGASISITAEGLSPSSVTISSGQSVTFTNTDSVAHEIVSAPVPSYDECPAINRVRRLEPGQTLQTGALTSSRSCGFLDLLRTGDSRWQGTINVQ
jgi:plastocyanin